MQTWAGIIATVLGVLLTSFIGLLTYVFHDWRNQVTEQNRQIRQRIEQIQGELDIKERHQSSMIHSIWNLTWRMNSVEDYLADTTDFRPPRVIGEGEAFGRKPE